MNNPFVKFFKKTDERSDLARKNIAVSFITKGIDILISLMIVPMTINYINPTQYGIWLTLSSIVAWIAFFDLGFAHGFRNRFAEAKAKGNILLTQKYTSTTYALLTIMFTALFVIVAVTNLFLDWGNILGVDRNMDSELTYVFFILTAFFCLRIVLSIITTLLTADQRPAAASIINTLGQMLALLIIYILSLTTQGSLVYLAYALSAIPCFVLFIATIFLFCTKYRIYIPRLSLVDLSLSRSIIGLGGKFFIIQLSMLVIFQFTNIIISRICGPIAVTQYNIAYKYFNVLFMGMVIILTPFWSAFTDAYTKNDIQWMRKSYRKLSNIWYLALIACVAMFAASKWIFHIWLNDAVEVSYELSAAMGIYIIMLCRANIYMFLINGIGKVRMQLYVYVAFALISIPLMVILCNSIGMVGVIWVSIIVYVAQTIVGHIQLKRIMNGTASGIWNK